MTIDEGTRHGIHSWFVEAKGQERADGLVSMLPPTGWADVATKNDLAHLEERMDLRFAMVDQKFEKAAVQLEAVEHKILGALDRRIREMAIAQFFALAGLLIALTTVIVSVVLATR